ncbi:BolA family protein [Paraburkholderia rhizosphaerae]|uniref:BolA protein family transcriptional regulator n=1 Tax=Paraburkholderia rhizosphaerae TaxID=480658 RepID=A0A4R8M0T0_9BURK|nr:BolA family protein [Paraburkholderia rhizosphaerae]TDY52853.1 BolA protein family transcriptional regulator [Paraburkholderia rhizosphaerae]
MSTDAFLHATPAERAALIEARLATALAPVESIAVRDDSAQHAGHAGAAAGGHFSVTIVAAAFAGKPRVARHRMVYDALADAMQRGIHALAITAYTPEEFRRLPRQAG